MDAIPVLSQLKSLVQVTFGRPEDALQTQINFSRQFPIVCQVRSGVELIMGDEEAALETQKECGRFVLGAIESVPVVGHISGGIRYAVGDTDGGDQAMKSASHSTAVIAGGIGGFFAGGPVGAVALGIGAGLAVDGAITGIDTAVHWEEEAKVRPYGVSEVFIDPTNPGKWFDATAGVVLDGVAGYGGGSAVKAGMRSGAHHSASSKILKGAKYIVTDELKSLPIAEVEQLDPHETDDESSDEGMNAVTRG